MKDQNPSAHMAPAAVSATVVIPLHNRGQFVGDLLAGLFEQWRPDFELLLIDDHSTDDGFAKAQEALAAHPNIRSTVLRTEAAEGMKLIGRIIPLSRGQILIQADSDDLALSGRLDAILNCFDQDPECRLVSSNALMIAEDSRAYSLYDTRAASEVFRDPLPAASLSGDPRWLGATMAYHRAIFESFPPLDAELCPYGLDLILPLRAVLLGSHHYLAEPLVGWRHHANNTHRREGHYDQAVSAQEQYQGLLTMALAQKVRDAEFIARERPSEALEATVKAARAQFALKFDEWCRLRSRAMSLGDRPKTNQNAFRPPQPAVPTLTQGETLLFNQGEHGASLLPYYPGFHQPELWGTWTERVAFLSVRIVTTAAPIPVKLQFRLKSSGLSTRHRIAIQIDYGLWAESEVGPEQEWTLEVDHFAATSAKTVDILILARDAVEPTRVEQRSTDGRLIGVGLLALSVADIDPASEVTDSQSGED